MSPEQVSGAPVDGRSDLFSLGVVLYELLTQRKPFQGDNLTAISYKIVHEDFTPPAELSTDVPPEFNPIVARAMAKDPWNRYQRGKDFALALYQLQAHLEEQKAMDDLGTIVSLAENVPTLKLENLAAIAAEGAPAGRRGVRLAPGRRRRLRRRPVSEAATAVAEASAGRRPSPAEPATVPPPPPPASAPPARRRRPRPSRDSEASGDATPGCRGRHEKRGRRDHGLRLAEAHDRESQPVLVLEDHDRRRRAPAHRCGRPRRAPGLGRAPDGDVRRHARQGSRRSAARPR